jgi:hypothetical protein
MTELPVVQVNGPTVEVMSLPALNAFAVNCSVWCCEAHTGGFVGPETAILSTCAWTNTGTVAVSPSEVTITFAVPSGNGLPLLSFVWQTTLLASNMPAQTSPAELTVTTLLFDELKVEVGVGEITMLFESSTWIELSCTTCPC